MIKAWILTICLSGHLNSMCETINEYEYDSQKDCIQAREALMKQPKSNIVYAVCSVSGVKDKEPSAVNVR